MWALKVSPINGWLPYVENVSRSAYGGGTQNWDIIQDNGGWIYVANNSGLLQFDGHLWRLFGKEQIVRSLYYDGKNRIYAGSFNQFGYYSPDKSGRLRYYSLSDRLDEEYRNFNDVWDIYCIDHNIYFVSYNHIFKYSGDQLSVVKSTNRIFSSTCINGSLYVFQENAGISLLAGELFIPIKNTRRIANYHVSGILPYHDCRQFFMITEYQGIYLYNGSETVRFKTLNDALLESSQLYCAKIFKEKMYIGTIKNGLLVVDIPTGRVEQYDVRSGIQNNSVLSIYLTVEGNVWLGLDNGITFLDMSNPLTNLYTANSNYGVGYTSIIHNRHIYFGTNQGLYCSPWPIEDIRNLHLHPVRNADGQVWNLTTIGGNLLCGHNNGSYLIAGNEAVPISETDGYWNFTQIPGKENLVLAGTYSGLVVLANEGSDAAPRWKLKHKVKGFDHSAHYVEYDEAEHVWWISYGTGYSIVELNADCNEVIFCKYFDDNSSDKFYFFKSDGQIYVNTVSGIKHYNHRLRNFEAVNGWKQFPYSTDYMRVLGSTEPGRLWLVERGNLKLYNRTNGTDSIDSLSFSRLRNNLMSDFEHVDKVDSNTYIFSTLDGFSLYRPLKDSVLVLANRYRFQIKRLCVSGQHPKSDTCLYFNGLPDDDRRRTMTIKYASNTSYRFEMNPDISPLNPCTYYVQLQGQDEEELPLNASGIKEYTGLNEGKYVFQVHAYNHFTQQHDYDRITLLVLPPWYRSIYAYTGYAGLMVGLMVVAYKLLKHKMNKQQQRCIDELKEESLKREFEMKEAALAQEKRIVELENSKLQQELMLKSQEVSNSMFYVIQKQEIFTFMQEELQKISAHLRRDQQAEALRKLSRLLEKVHANIEDEDNWKKLENNFNIVHNNFLSRLKEKYPDLTVSELKLSAYIRMNLITKEVAPLFNLSERGMESARYRLRKKLGLSREESLSKFLQDF